MVSPASSVPFSYLDKLKGTSGALPQKNPPPAFNAQPKAVAPVTNDKPVTTDKLAQTLGLSNEILNILQGSDTGSDTVAKNPLSALFGDSDQPSASDILSQIYNKLLSASATSTALQTAAQNAAAKQSAANLQTDPLDKILADYSKAQNSNNEFLKPQTQVTV